MRATGVCEGCGGSALNERWGSAQRYCSQACRQRGWRRHNPERSRGIERRAEVKRRYGLTTEEYDARLAKPCAICGEPSEVLDHDHASGLPRAGLCGACNRALGGFRDNPALLRAAAAYVEEWRNACR